MDCLSRSFGFLFDVFHLGGDLESPLASVAVAPIRTLSPFDVFSHSFLAQQQEQLFLISQGNILYKVLKMQLQLQFVN